ncbi:hypothetical protein K1T71_009707 [Dendrolimus kikuchii]|uniref:Uncharacterized protein n=1 Tax=Dendrolimus kikuchii TaxID=765133 RepID=A0ACC1CSD8_9NEOP|nr:hypothetical protein K1T71_009707 [Dendrolimus kikuchii]
MKGGQREGCLRCALILRYARVCGCGRGWVVKRGGTPCTWRLYEINFKYCDSLYTSDLNIKTGPLKAGSQSAVIHIDRPFTDPSGIKAA